MSAASDPFRAPDYAAPRMPSVGRDPVDWPREITTGIVVAVFAALLGAAVGVVWHALAPHIDIVSAAQGSTATDKFLIGDDLWLGLIGGLAGIVCVAGLLAVAPGAGRGPGATLGLAVGGLLGMLVAARVGHLIGHPDLKNAFTAHYPTIGPKVTELVLHFFDFSVRAKAVLLTWPFVAVAFHTILIGFSASKEPAPRYAAAYPGSS